MGRFAEGKEEKRRRKVGRGWQRCESLQKLGLARSLHKRLWVVFGMVRCSAALMLACCLDTNQAAEEIPEGRIRFLCYGEYNVEAVKREHF